MPPRRVESKPSQTTNGKVGQQKSEKQQAKNEHLPKKTLTRPDSPLTVADKAIANVSNSLELLYEPSSELAESMSKTLKTLYDFAKKTEPKELSSASALPSLLVDGFDAEQIWEELRLHSDPFLSKSANKVNTLLKQIEDETKAKEEEEEVAMQRDKHDMDGEEDEDEDDDLMLGEEDDELDQYRDLEEDEDDLSGLLGDEDEDIEGLMDEEDDEEEMNHEGDKKEKKNSKRGSELDDGFFNLEEFERFSDLADKMDRKRQKIAGGDDGDMGEDEEEGVEDEWEKLRQSIYGPSVGNKKAKKGKQKDEDDDEEDVSDFDFSKDVPNDDNVMYGDFFLPPKSKKQTKRRKLNDGTRSRGDEEEEEEEEKEMSVKGRKGKKTKGEGKKLRGIMDIGADEADLDLLDEDDEEDDNEEEGLEEDGDDDNMDDIDNDMNGLDGDEDEDEDLEDGEEMNDDDDNGNMNKKKKKDGTETTEKDQDDEEGESSGSLGRLSSQAKRDLAMRKQIEALEDQIVGPKTWDMIGETKAHLREKDALLETHLEVDYATKLSTPITEEVSMEIEEIIRARIRDLAFDDVKPRVMLDQKPFVPKEEVSVEKSKFGLAEIYEKEFMREAMGDDAAPTEAQSKLKKEHEEISTLMAALFHKLDALSNYNYTPKAPTQELSVVSSSSAVEMEEVLPMGVSTEQRVAPQEVFTSKSAGLLAARSELGKEESEARRKARREAKAKHFAIKDTHTKEQAMAGSASAKKELEQKDMQKKYKEAAGKKVVERSKASDDTKYSTSTAFFQKLHENESMDKRLEGQGKGKAERAPAARKAAASGNGGAKSGAHFMK